MVSLSVTAAAVPNAPRTRSEMVLVVWSTSPTMKPSPVRLNTPYMPGRTGSVLSTTMATATAV